MSVFISHIHEEAALAFVLKEWLETTFLGQWDVFVSSDSDDIAPGSRWLDKVDKALEESRVLLILCSSRSITRPWINFEAGCGWIKSIPIIPICHSGLTKSNLPAPLSAFQSLQLSDSDFPKRLLEGLAKHLGVLRLPIINYDLLTKQLLESIDGIVYTSEISHLNNNPNGSVPVQANYFPSLSEPEVLILQYSGDFENEGLTA